MLILVSSKNSSSQKIQQLLNRGAVLVLPSDTFYGFSCLAENRAAVERVYQIKNRPKKKSFIILCADLAMAKKYFIISSEQEKIIKNYLNDHHSRATSFILKLKKNKLSFFSNADKDGLALRLPKDKFLSKIIKDLDAPLISTSCNLSGQQALNNLNKIFSFFNKQKYQADYLIKLKGYRPKRRPSKIIDIREPQNLKIIRG